MGCSVGFSHDDMPGGMSAGGDEGYGTNCFRYVGVRAAIGNIAVQNTL
jgi:hypothetical protein